MYTNHAAFQKAWNSIKPPTEYLGMIIFPPAVDVGIEMRMHARLMSAIACTTVPKITFIIGNSFGIDNYLMVGHKLYYSFLVKKLVQS